MAYLIYMGRHNSFTTIIMDDLTNGSDTLLLYMVRHNRFTQQWMFHMWFRYFYSDKISGCISHGWHSDNVYFTFNTTVLIVNRMFSSLTL